MSIEDTFDVIVIGGGPAGMMAAGRAGERGLRVLLLEKNSVLGKKLSITGGGRCNITNAEFDDRRLLTHYGEAEQFLYSAFSQFSVEKTFSFFEKLNLPLKIEERNRAFPRSEKASDVTRAMERYMREHGVTVMLNIEVKGLKTKDNELIGVITDEGTFSAGSYVIASGGRSHGETGSTGEGISWLKSLGHTTYASNPNLVPLVVKEAWIKKMSGTVLHDARITFMQGEKKVSKEGNILVTHFGLSGPTILNAAHEVKALLKDGEVRAKIDLFPTIDTGNLRTKLNELLQQHSNKTLANALKEWFPKAIIEALLMDHDDEIRARKVHSVERETRHKLVDAMKELSLTVTGTMGYEWAIVSDGGVDLREVDTKTMRSKLHPNIYFVGDVLHINRPSGGYSLQLCWTTGWVAGEHV